MVGRCLPSSVSIRADLEPSWAGVRGRPASTSPTPADRPIGDRRRADKGSFGRASMFRVSVRLVRLDGDRLQEEWTTRPFTQNPGFNDSWWLGDAKGPLVFCSFTADDDVEVARAQIKPHSTLGVAYPTYARRHLDSTEIVLLEVRIDLQGRGLGHDVVDRLRVEFNPPYIALSLDERSDHFWRSLRWTEHSHPNDRGAALFAQPD